MLKNYECICIKYARVVVLIYMFAATSEKIQNIDSAVYQIRFETLFIEWLIDWLTVLNLHKLSIFRCECSSGELRHLLKDKYIKYDKYINY